MSRDFVERVRREYDGCFACGRDNHFGLHLDGWALDADGYTTASFQPRPEYRGAGDSLHGGVAATALDEALVWAGILSEGVLTVTGTLDLRFRKPLTIHRLITARARVEERRGKRLTISGHLDAGDGPAVEGRGLYLVAMALTD